MNCSMMPKRKKKYREEEGYSKSFVDPGSILLPSKFVAGRSRMFHGGSMIVAGKVVTTKGAHELRDRILRGGDLLPPDVSKGLIIPDVHVDGWFNYVETVVKIGKGFLLTIFEKVDTNQKLLITTSPNPQKHEILRFQTYLVNKYMTLVNSEKGSTFSQGRCAFFKIPEFYEEGIEYFCTEVEKGFRAAYNEEILKPMGDLEAAKYLFKYDAAETSWEIAKEFDDRK